FIANGSTVKKKVAVVTYQELVDLWWDSYKNTVKPNTRQSMKGLIRVHLLPVFGDYKVDKLTTPIIQQQVNKWSDK
ncbi:N-terminal phage integrase SAM-like domain-containing protein, partial [Streptococcus suis]